jgi:outer membrane protein TolC
MKTKGGIFLIMILFASAGSPLRSEEAEKTALKIDMDTAVRIGVANHFALKAVKYRTEVVDKIITERWRQYLPTLDLSYNRQREIVKGERDTTSHEVRLTIEQVIYDGGRRGLDLDMARLNSILARKDFNVIYGTVRLDIVRAYVRVLAASGKIDLNRKSLERGRLQLKDARREFEVGFSTRLQVMQVASLAQEIELSLMQSINEHSNAVYQLKVILNLDHSIRLELDGDILRDYRLEIPGVDVDELIDRARQARPEVLRSRVNIFRLDKEKEIAEDYWIPQLSVGGFAGRRGEEFPLTEDTWGVFFRFTFPIFSNSTESRSDLTSSTTDNSVRSDTSSRVSLLDNLGYDRAILESRLALTEAVDQHKQLEQQIALEVQQAYTNMREAWEEIRIGNGRFYFQYETARLLTTQFQVGQGKRSDIVFAESELVQAQEDLVDALARFLTSGLELEFAAGMDPGALESYEYAPGNGNTLLSQMELNFTGPLSVKSADFDAEARLRLIEELEGRGGETDAEERAERDSPDGDETLRDGLLNRIEIE